ncbi:MAG: hypothetical protein HY660_16690 [Armatimonadetes bacterium]|nr:hypothetical protein [Armatimonadota bacterium]
MLRVHLAAFDNLPLVTPDYEQAAVFHNHCRDHGVTGTHIDLLICAVAARRRLAIFTTDRDFPRYARYLPIRRHDPSAGGRHGREAPSPSEKSS